MESVIRTTLVLHWSQYVAAVAQEYCAALRTVRCRLPGYRAAGTDLRQRRRYSVTRRGGWPICAASVWYSYTATNSTAWPGRAELRLAVRRWRATGMPLTTILLVVPSSSPWIPILFRPGPSLVLGLPRDVATGFSQFGTVAAGSARPCSVSVIFVRLTPSRRAACSLSDHRH
ncbi:hypothetical protein J6590_028658 [Homalodisca vitripennis]|nr:hypothetical protein J6590_028658 [Homalodisca vitripennis]